MIVIDQNTPFTIEWTMLRGASAVLENLSRATLKIWLVSSNDRVPLSDWTYTRGKSLVISVPQGLEAGSYGIYCLWVKNEGHVVDTRNIEKAEIEPFFAITDVESEATEVGENICIRVTSRVGTYGYDGLDAYEMMTMKGAIAFTEKEWLNSLAAHVTPNGILIDAYGQKWKLNPYELLENTVDWSALQASYLAGSTIDLTAITCTSEDELTFIIDGEEYEGNEYTPSLGQHTIKATIKEGCLNEEYAELSGDVEKTITVAKGINPIVITANPALTAYTGQAQSLFVVPEGSNVLWADDDYSGNSVEWIYYEEGIPQGTDAGEYTMYYYVPATDAYEAKFGSVTATIEKADNTVDWSGINSAYSIPDGDVEIDLNDVECTSGENLKFTINGQEYTTYPLTQGETITITASIMGTPDPNYKTLSNVTKTVVITGNPPVQPKGYYGSSTDRTATAPTDVTTGTEFTSGKVLDYTGSMQRFLWIAIPSGKTPCIYSEADAKDDINVFDADSTSVSGYTIYTLSGSIQDKFTITF